MSQPPPPTPPPPAAPITLAYRMWAFDFKSRSALKPIWPQLSSSQLRTLAVDHLSKAPLPPTEINSGFCGLAVGKAGDKHSLCSLESLWPKTTSKTIHF